MGARRKTVFLKVRKTEVWIVSKKARPRFSLLKSERGRACSSCLWFPELSRMASKNGKGPIQRTVNSEVQIVFTGRVSTTRAIRSDRLPQQTGWAQASSGRNHGVPV